MSLNEKDAKFLRQSFALADEAKQQGIHPFAAILVDDQENVLMSQVNGYLPDLDMTGHAERKLMTRASKAYRPDFLANCTMYVSAEPCAMCAGSAY
ncbi:nucleoside deaminase [Marinomonas sp. GJ51-6]|uniref:nucleoside deaminase n=1 Tax=Marinomonas sp. GJ51-6 TaxID=2992802 RepID=UPI002934825A|nr:nucleoside deaminase [Marinomonas sp. GJ51-6]WOD07690.1 nucleoside deaminase [Marinomonas sp. GJ51-6]